MLNCFKSKISAGQQPFVKFVRILNIFDDHEAGRKKQRHQHILVGFGLIILTCAINSECHGQRTTNQHDRVDATQHFIQMMRGFMKHFRIEGSKDNVDNKETTEEQNFSHQKEPNAQLRCLKGLFRTVKMVRNNMCRPCCNFTVSHSSLLISEIVPSWLPGAEGAESTRYFLGRPKKFARLSPTNYCIPMRCWWGPRRLSSPSSPRQLGNISNFSHLKMLMLKTLR